MPEIKRTFNGGKMNRDLDDRILPPGDYREAFNVNIGQSEASDVGSIENLLGNELVAQNPIANGKCIGYVSDSKTEKIYFFVIGYLLILPTLPDCWLILLPPLFTTNNPASVLDPAMAAMLNAFSHARSNLLGS